MYSSMPGESANRISQAVNYTNPKASSDLQRGNVSESWKEFTSDKAEQRRQFSLLKAYNFYKAEFPMPLTFELELWRKIAEAVREECPISVYYGAKECHTEMRSIKRKYYKVKKGKLDVSSPGDGILIEEAKLAFDSLEPVSDKVKQERQLAALKAYNFFKDEFSVPNVCEPELWGKIAGIVREEFPNIGYYGAPQCRDEVRSIKNKYLKARRGKLDVTSPDDVILNEEARLAFDIIAAGSGSTKTSKLIKQEDELALLRAYNEYKDELSSCPEYQKRAVWKQIAKQVRINRSVNGVSGFNEKNCHNQMLALQKKYEKNKNRKSKITNPDLAIFMNEAALAFDDSEFQDNINSCGRDSHDQDYRSNSYGGSPNPWNDRMGYGKDYSASDYSSPGEFMGKSCGYRRDSYGGGRGSNSQSGPPSASNDGIMDYGRDTRDSYGSSYGNDSQRGPPNASNEGNEYGSGYRRDSYDGGYGNNSQRGPSNASNEGNDYGSGYSRDSYSGGYGNNSQRRSPNASNEGNDYGSGYRRDSYGGGYGSNNQGALPSTWSNAMGYR